MSEFNPERIFQALVEAGESWADLESAAQLLEESRKSVLAHLCSESSGSSAAAKEQDALAQPAYKLHITNMVTARKKANQARVRYDAQKVLAELRRTQQSNRRAEMNLR